MVELQQPNQKPLLPRLAGKQTVRHFRQTGGTASASRSAQVALFMSVSRLQSFSKIYVSGGTCKIDRGSRSNSYSYCIQFRFDSRKKGFCKRLSGFGVWPLAFSLGNGGEPGVMDSRFDRIRGPSVAFRPGHKPPSSWRKPQVLQTVSSGSDLLFRNHERNAQSLRLWDCGQRERCPHFHRRAAGRIKRRLSFPSSSFRVGAADAARSVRRASRRDGRFAPCAL